MHAQADSAAGAIRSIDDAASGSALLGDGAVLIWNDVATEGRTQFYDWHDKEHLPERLAIPGFRRGRRYARAGHSPEWLTLYEARDVDVLTSPDYLARLNTPTPLTHATLPHFRRTSRAVCRVACTRGSSSGGHVLALRLDGDAAAQQGLVNHVATEAFPRALRHTGIVACHLFASDRGGSYVDTAESRTREFDVPAWVILVEATTTAAADAVRRQLDPVAFRGHGVRLRNDGAVYSLEICRLGNWKC
jgi:hypothetical protein